MIGATTADSTAAAVGRGAVRFTSATVQRTVFAAFVVLASIVFAFNLSSGLRAVPLTAMVLALGYLSVVDLAKHRLPNRVVGPMVGLSFLTVLADGLLGTLSLSAAVAHIAVGLTAAVVLLLLRFGPGDVKLVVAVGTVASWLGPEAVTWTVLVASASGAVAAMGLMVAYRRVRLDFAFGPFLALGSTVGMIAAGIAG